MCEGKAEEPEIEAEERLFLEPKEAEVVVVEGKKAEVEAEAEACRGVVSGER